MPPSRLEGGEDDEHQIGEPGQVVPTLLHEDGRRSSLVPGSRTPSQ
jgi:hypothetical protein